MLVPFGGAEHEWGALELGAWTRNSVDVPMRLLGTAAAPDGDRRDASRLLAGAALAVQQLAGVVTEPVLVAVGPEGVVDAAGPGDLIVLGLSERWRQEGLETRARPSSPRACPRSSSAGACARAG